MLSLCNNETKETGQRKQIRNRIELKQICSTQRIPIPRAESKSKGVETLHPLKAGHSNKAFELRQAWTSNGAPLLEFVQEKIKSSQMPSARGPGYMKLLERLSLFEKDTIFFMNADVFLRQEFLIKY